MGKKNKKSFDESDDFNHNPFAAKFGGPKNPPPPVEEEIEHDLKSARIRVEVSRKGRGGRTVCLVRGIPPASAEEVEKKLKKGLGTGASWEDDALMVMGDQRDRVIDLLTELGATDVKPSGG